MPVSRARTSWLANIGAFAAIYIVWGSTYYAIRVLVQTVPPVLAAGLRFAIAGSILTAWAYARGETRPTPREWRNLASLGALLFLVDYALLFWAETKIDSGIAAVLLSLVPIWTSLFEVFISKRERGGVMPMLALLMGVAGVAVLTGVGRHGGGSQPLLPCLAILVSGFSWAIGTVLSKTLALPHSKALSSGAQMLLGGVLLLVSSLALGEVPPLPHFTAPATVALWYLIGGGSILAFTCYVYLIKHMPATKVASYAYVNPVVAILLGHWLGKEQFTPGMAAGSALILVSVIVTLRHSSVSSPAPASSATRPSRS